MSGWAPNSHHMHYTNPNITNANAPNQYPATTNPYGTPGITNNYVAPPPPVTTTPYSAPTPAANPNAGAQFDPFAPPVNTTAQATPVQVTATIPPAFNPASSTQPLNATAEPVSVPVAYDPTPLKKGSSEFVAATVVLPTQPTANAFEMNDVAYALPVELKRHPSGERFSQQYFQEYDHIISEINRRQHVPAHIDENRRNMVKRQDHLRQTKSQLAKTRAAKPKLSKRIDRNENPRFFHYMQVGRQDKVNKLKSEYEELEAKEKKLVDRQEQIESKIASLESESRQLSSEQNNANVLEQKRDQMFKDVVASVPASPTLTELIMSKTAKQTEIQKESSLREQVSTSMHGMEKAMSLYKKSMEMLQQAAGSNMRGQVFNLGDSGGAEFIETHQQLQRNRLVNESQKPAAMAAQVMADAIRAFPDEAVRRYPSLCAQIGHAPLPKLEGASLGGTLGAKVVFGDVGDAMHGIHAGQKIRRNMGTIQQCMQIVSEQIRLAQVVYDEIGRGIDRSTGELNTFKSQEAHERQCIFQMVKSQYVR